MKKIAGFSATAPKIKQGNIEYCLWTDAHGALYFQITKNDIDTKNPGTHSKNIFRISDCLNNENFADIEGINPETLAKEKTTDNNNAMFIKAVITHLLPKK